MRSIQILSTQLLSSFDKDKSKKKTKIFLEETKSNSVSSADSQKDINNHEYECEEIEKNNFDICFCLSKDLIDKIENEDEPIISQDNKLEQTNNFVNHQKNQNQFHFDLSQNDLNNNNYYLNENNVNPKNQHYNLNNSYCDTHNINILKNYLSKYHDRKIGNFTIKMFGKTGWICQFCDNFNYQERKKCNRCHNKKKAKNIQNLFPEDYFNDREKGDWLCNYCGNLNFSFREICNICKIQKNNIIIS
jgi:hypothetical protein